MPLDSQNKINHLQAMVTKSWVGRTQSVVFVSQASGVWAYTLQSVIFRRLEVIDPEIPNTSGAAPRQIADAVMIVPLSVSMTGVIYVAYTATATSAAVATADKYEIIEVTPTGIIPGGTHYTVDLRRLR